MAADTAMVCRCWGILGPGQHLGEVVVYCSRRRWFVRTACLLCVKLWRVFSIESTSGLDETNVTVLHPLCEHSRCLSIEIWMGHRAVRVFERSFQQPAASQQQQEQE